MELQKAGPDGDHRATMVFVLHNHQPAGNFSHVFRESFDRCYRPTLDLLWQYETLHASLHYTGPLLEWIESNEPSFLDRLKKMVERGQAEVIGGGFYEPIFCWLRSADQRRQVDLMRRHLETRLGISGEGFWLAERVWETDLPARLYPLGLTYAPLDDHHFHLAGIDDEDLHGYYTVPWEGAPLRIFPISKELRYLIPFRQVDQLLSFLDRRARGGRVLTYADDGEKFGIWPETYRWVWEEKYLEHLFSMLSAQSGWLRVASMGEVVADRTPTGIAVLPNASYTEMMEWALPARISHTFHEWSLKWEREGADPDLRVLFRGGIFENFLVKYPDVHRLYHRMLLTGAFLREAWPSSEPPEGVLSLYLKAQGNDVYWHGLFGGIYLSNLRHEAFANLLMAEQRMESEGKLPVPAFLEGDFDADGTREFFVRQRSYNLWITPRYGGSVLEWDDRITGFHLTNTLTRQEEAYHIRHREDRKKMEGATASEGGIASIHDRPVGDTGHALEGIIYDRRPRRAFSEGFAPIGTPAPGLLDGSALSPDMGRTPYRVVSGPDGRLQMEGAGEVAGIPFLLSKGYRFFEDHFSVTWTLSSPGLTELPDSWKEWALFAELPLTLLAGHDSGRTIHVDGRKDPFLWDEPWEHGEVGWYRGEDSWSKTAFLARLSGVVRLIHAPIETVSLSESGLERIFQGTLFIHAIPIAFLLGGEARITIFTGPDSRSQPHA